MGQGAQGELEAKQVSVAVAAVGWQGKPCGSSAVWVGRKHVGCPASAPAYSSLARMWFEVAGKRVVQSACACLTCAVCWLLRAALHCSCWLLQMLAVALQSRISEVFHVDIHPAATFGRGILLDHATGVVIGETAVVGDNVSMLHHVTLGGSGTGKGIRHPTIGHGVLLGAGVSVLGNVTVGCGAKVGAGSVVVSDLPCHSVAVGVPARIVKQNVRSEPCQDMDQTDFTLDYVI